MDDVFFSLHATKNCFTLFLTILGRFWYEVGILISLNSNLKNVLSKFFLREFKNIFLESKHFLERRVKQNCAGGSNKFVQGGTI